MVGGGNSRELDQTPTWAVASVCSIIILISILLEKGIHHVGLWFTKRRKFALFEALEKVKDELMVLGFISLLLTFGQQYIVKICIPESSAGSMLPCYLEAANVTAEGGGTHRRRILSVSTTGFSIKHRILAGASSGSSCPLGKVPFVSLNGLHQLHIFVFFLAVFHVAYSALTMALGRAKIRRWKEWEKETLSPEYEFSIDPSRFRFSHETTFVRQHASFWNTISIFFYIVSFFRQFFRSVQKEDYLALRHGFINAHLAPGSKFEFRKYIKRSLEDDFKVVVGISPLLWSSAVIFLLLNVSGWQTLFWVSLVPLSIILAVGTKLQAIITKMAVGIQEKHAVIQGVPLVHLSDHHFWFGNPRLVLFLIHFALFQNAFQIIYFFWIWYEFGLNSCFHENFHLIITRICIGVGVQFLCSYITLPLYALVSQMGSNMKRTIFNEETSKALKEWHQAVKKRNRERSSRSPSMTPGGSSRSSLNGSAVHPLHRFRTLRNSSPRRSYSDHDTSDMEIDAQSSPTKQYSVSRVEAARAAEHHLTVELQRGNKEDFSFIKSSPHPEENI